MEKVYMQITSGRGPAECCRVVALVLEKILKQAVAKGVKTEIVERETGPLNRTLLSAVISYNRQIKKFPTEKQNVSLKHILT